MTAETLRLFKTIFDQTPISTQIFTPDGETVMVNKAWEKLWQISFKKLGSYNVLSDQQLVENGVMPYIKRGFRGEMVEIPVIKYIPEKSVKTKKTVPFRWVGAKMYPIHDRGGDISHIVLQHEDMTQQVETAEMKNRMAAIVESSDDAIVGKDLNDIITSWNKSAQELFGYSGKEAIGRHINIIVPKELQKQEEGLIGKIRQGIPIDHFETERVKKNGKRITVSLTVSPIKDSTGKIIGASKIARDITQQKQAEESLRESEEVFRALTSLAPVGIFMTDEDGNCLFVNKKWCDMAGMTMKQALGEGWGNALHPDDRKRIFSEWYAAAKSIKPFKLEYRFMTPKEKVSWVVGNAIALRDENNQITGYMGTVTDITERKKAEDAVRESEERLRIALNAGKIGVWDWDLKQQTLTWTENVYKIHGVSPKHFSVNFESFINLIHPQDRGQVLKAVEESVQGTAPFMVEFRIITPKGDTRWIYTSARLMRNARGEAERMLGATIDITDRKELEQEKSDFMSMASHELKTPLTSIQIFVNLLESHLPEDSKEKVGYYLYRITEQMHRLADLINDLLDVSRIETGKLRLNKEKFSIDELLFDTIESIKPTARDQTIVFKDRIKAEVYADRYRLYQVIINLLTNAIKYSPKGKQIIVSVKKNRKEVIVSIKDFGIGIKADKQEKIFEKLYQVSDPKEKTYPGLGLGLYISKEIIDRHKGKIWVESEGRDKGSTFFFTLPVA